MYHYETYHLFSSEKEEKKIKENILLLQNRKYFSTNSGNLFQVMFLLSKQLICNVLLCMQLCIISKTFSTYIKAFCKEIFLLEQCLLTV